MDGGEVFRTPVAGLRLRFAGEGDTGRVLAFIRELAAYERLAHEVVADEETLRKNLFGARPFAEVVLAELEGETVGFALFFHNFSTFLGRPGIYLEDLFVRPEHRGRGIGTVLLAFLARLAVERGCGRLDWAVLDWNRSAMEFYRGLGARSLDDWKIFRLDGKALESVARRLG